MNNLDNLVSLIIIVSGIFTYKGLTNFQFFEKYKFNIYSLINKQQYYRILTSTFLHVNWMHFAFNMITLYFFAPFILLHGHEAFLVIYIGSILSSGISSYYFHKNNLSYSAVGASGAISGILFAGIIIHPTAMIYGIIPSFIFGALYLWYTIKGIKNSSDNIGHSSHLGGALGGIILVFLYEDNLDLYQWVAVSLMSIPLMYFYWVNLEKK